MSSESSSTSSTTTTATSGDAPSETSAQLAAAGLTPITDHVHLGAPIDDTATFGDLKADYKAAAQAETTYRLKGLGPMDGKGNRRYGVIGLRFLMPVRAVLANLKILQDACMLKGEILFAVEVQNKKELEKEMEKPMKEGEQRRLAGYHIPPVFVIKLANPALFATDPVVEPRIKAELEKLLKVEPHLEKKKNEKKWNAEMLEKATAAAALGAPKAEVAIPASFRAALDRAKGLCSSLSEAFDQIDVAHSIFCDGKKLQEQDMTLTETCDAFVKWYAIFKPIADELVAEARKLDREARTLLLPRTIVALQNMLSAIGEQAAWAESELLFKPIIRYAVPISKNLVREIVAPHMVGLEAGEEVSEDKLLEALKVLEARKRELEMERIVLESKMEAQAAQMESAALQAQLPIPTEGATETDPGKEKEEGEATQETATDPVTETEGESGVVIEDAQE